MPGNQFAYDLPALTITPSMSGVAQKVITGNLNDGWLLVYNETPFDLMVRTSSDSVLHPVGPQIIGKVALHAGDDVIFVTPVLYLPGAAPSSLIKFKLFPYGEPDGDFPVALPRQTAPTARTAAAGFEASQNFDGTPASAGVGPFLQVNNASANTVKGTFTLARIVVMLTTTLAAPQLEMGFSSSLGSSSVIINPNNTVNVSQFTATGSATAGARPASPSIYQLITLDQSNVGVPYTYDFIVFPGQKELPPGQSFYLFIHNVTVAISGVLLMGWAEQ